MFVSERERERERVSERKKKREREREEKGESKQEHSKLLLTGSVYRAQLARDSGCAYH